MDAVLELLMLIIIFIGILGLTYIVTKKMAMMNRRMHFNKNMEVVEVLQLAQGQYLYIIKVGETYHLIGSTQKGGICYCHSLEEQTLDLKEVEVKCFKGSPSLPFTLSFSSTPSLSLCHSLNFKFTFALLLVMYTSLGICFSLPHSSSHRH